MTAGATTSQSHAPGASMLQLIRKGRPARPLEARPPFIAQSPRTESTFNGTSLAAPTSSRSEPGAGGGWNPLVRGLAPRPACVNRRVSDDSGV